MEQNEEQVCNMHSEEVYNTHTEEVIQLESQVVHSYSEEYFYSRNGAQDTCSGVASASPKMSYMVAVESTPPSSQSKTRQQGTNYGNNGKFSSLTPNSSALSSVNDISYFPPSQTISESLITLASTTASKLEEVWEEVGYTPEERANQIAELLSDFRRLCDEKVTEEKNIAERYRQSICSAKDEIEAASKALKIEIDPQLLEENHMSLTDELANLELTLEGLRSSYAVAKAELTGYKDRIAEIHEILGSEMSPFWVDVSSDLTAERSEEFRAQVNEMEEVLSTRKNTIMQLLIDCQTLMRELCIDTQEELSPLDKKIMSSLVRNDDDTLSVLTEVDNTGESVCLHAATIDDLTLRLTDLTKEKRRRKEILGGMGGKIAMLWAKLKIPEHEQNLFTQSVRSLGMETIKKGEIELQRLHDLKSEMIGKLILEARKKIDDLWKKTNFGKNQRENFEAWKIDDESLFTDDLLEEHERYISYLKHKLEQLQPILRYIDRREEIIKERIEYEELQRDPDRLRNRGAALSKQLMKEEKMSRRIKRDLPKYTEALEKKLNEWEGENDELFFYRDERYLDTMRRQEIEWHNYKENLALMKHRKKQEEIGIDGAITHPSMRPLPGRKKCINISGAIRSQSRSQSRPQGRSESRSRSNLRARPLKEVQNRCNEPPTGNQSRINGKYEGKHNVVKSSKSRTMSDFQPKVANNENSKKSTSPT